ncbi:hypothetical protein ACFVUW_11730 [Streptomyces xiamenensis]|uniref:hypothetical protein n=1 Tax=Streptomyces xiamenensis TaxID=408015 RepID=UPI0036E25692
MPPLTTVPPAVTTPAEFVQLLRGPDVSAQDVYDATATMGLHDLDAWQFMKAVSGAYLSPQEDPANGSRNFADMIPAWNPDTVGDYSSTVKALLAHPWTFRHYTKATTKPSYYAIESSFDLMKQGNLLSSAATREGSTFGHDWAALGNVKFTFACFAVGGVSAHGKLVGHSQKLSDHYHYYAEWPVNSPQFTDCWLSKDLKDIRYDFTSTMIKEELEGYPGQPYPLCRGTGEDIATAMALYLSKIKLPGSATPPQIAAKISNSDGLMLWEIKNPRKLTVTEWLPVTDNNQT